MKRILITIVGFICCILNAVSAEKLVSHFQDTSAQCALQKNLVADYGAKPDSHEDQSAIWQNAIEELSASGGGRLIVPKGNYHIAEIRMCSNVHDRGWHSAHAFKFKEEKQKHRHVLLFRFYRRFGH